MQKLFTLAALPLLLTACATQRCCCPDHSTCACPTCNPNYSKLTPANAASSLPSNTPTRIYPIAPKAMTQKLEQTLTSLGFTIASSQGGVIETGWKDYEGEFHIARRWQERTRFRISIIPDVTDPLSASRFEITHETQRRSNDRAAWESIETPRPTRLTDLANSLHTHLTPR